MSKNKPKLLFGNWTMWDLNPNNYSLKNDFLENLIHLGSVVAGFARKIDGCKIIKCYEPLSVTGDVCKFEKFHCSGSAIALFYEGYNKEEMKNNLLINSFLDNQLDTFVSIVLYDDMIRFVQDGKAALYELVDGKERVIYKKSI